MHRIAISSLAGIMLSAACLAQEPNPYDGSWRAAYEGRQKAQREGKVVISGQGGSWDMAAFDRRDPCVGRPAPITVRQATPEELVFEIGRSKVLTGCRDGVARFRPVDDKTLQGHFDGRREMTLTRE